MGFASSPVKSSGGCRVLISACAVDGVGRRLTFRLTVACCWAWSGTATAIDAMTANAARRSMTDEETLASRTRIEDEDTRGLPRLQRKRRLRAIMPRIDCRLQPVLSIRSAAAICSDAPAIKTSKQCSVTVNGWNRR
jgi:hypothetical protein